MKCEKYNECIIGLDVSSRATGITIAYAKVSKIGGLYSYRFIKFNFDEIKMRQIKKYKNEAYYYQELKKQIKEKITDKIQKWEDLKFSVIVEQNLRHSSLVKSYAYWIACLTELFLVDFDIVEVAPSKWYHELKLGTPNDNRKKRKQNSIEYLKNYDRKTHLINIDDFKLTNDISDSFCLVMWYVL